MSGDARYDAGFFAGHHDLSSSSARAVLGVLFETYRAGSVLDVGCGDGAWLAQAGALGAGERVGVDGGSGAAGSFVDAGAEFVLHDLAGGVDLGRRFDLVISMEVGEHLPESSAEGFVESLTRHGDVVLFSAAVPKQGGRGHVNERWPGYWAGLFGARGFACVDLVRRRVWEDERVAWWYAQNALLFVHERALAGHAGLRAAHERWGGAPLALVHPRNYLWKAKHFTFEDGG